MSTQPIFLVKSESVKVLKSKTLYQTNTNLNTPHPKQISIQLHITTQNIYFGTVILYMYTQTTVPYNCFCVKNLSWKFENLVLLSMKKAITIYADTLFSTLVWKYLALIPENISVHNWYKYMYHIFLKLHRDLSQRAYLSQIHVTRWWNKLMNGKLSQGWAQVSHVFHVTDSNSF